MDTELHTWKQAGAVSLWRYTEFKHKFGGWHLSADSAGIASLLALVQALQSAPGSHRTISVTPPSDRLLKVPNYQQGAALWAAPKKWQLRFSAVSATWLFPAQMEPAELCFGREYLPQLVAGLEGIPKGEGDFCIGSPADGNLALWFWWRQGAA